MVNAERAWVMGELGWYESLGLRIVTSTQTRNEDMVDTTTVNVKLTCRNDGRSPAWIDQVYAQVEIFSTAATLGNKKKSECQTFGPMGPLGAGKEQSRVLELTCLGHRKDEKYLAVYAVLEYRDIFGIKRETVLGYSIDSDGEIYRQDALRERNRNT